MNTQIFVNLPVADLDLSMDFFRQLGFEFNPQYTDATAACMVVSDDIYAMLLTHAKFKEFIPNEIGDAKTSNEVLVCLSVESREKVDELVRKAVAAGGSTFDAPKDYGFMYQHGFQDPDGHIWELISMTENAEPVS
jgi:predicted lactoylglutathione lyase